MSNAQIIKEAVKLLSKLKGMTEFSSSNAFTKENLTGFELMVKEAVELKERQEDLQSELLILSLDLNSKIEEIMNATDVIEKALNKNEKSQEDIEKLLGLN